ncbi:MAG TPA: 4Fe-4S dicluster domain-containing protein, partial [Gemmatimonadaceae bacterium]|nr:4Fe-4S dicluster domain-containing protein [Gemmatimonadaceae bacterium]
MSTTARSCAIPDTPLARELPGIMTCVHCGFCLQACPTYLALGEENDSPRGRIVLMRSLIEGELSVDDADVHTHIDRCLGCRACETACPSGVPYGQLLEATRATLNESRPLAPIARLILWVFARPFILSVAMALGRLARATGVATLMARAPGRLGFAGAMLASTKRALPSRAYTRRGTTARERVAILEGCVMKGLFADTNRATERVLTA